MGVCNEMEEKMDSLQWDVLENIVSGNGGVSSVVWESFDYNMTKQIARFLGEKVLPGTVISLIGDLGVGKTVFAQGFAEGLKIDDMVNSPTFTIVQIYEEGRIPLYHFDVYRIEDPDEMYEVGFEDYFYGEGVCLVEWADLIRELLPENHIRIEIRKNTEKGFDYREITIAKQGA